MTGNIWGKFEIKMMAILLLVIVSLSFCIYYVFYSQYYSLMRDGLAIVTSGAEYDYDNLYNSFKKVRIGTIIVSISIACFFIIISFFIIIKVVKNTEAVLQNMEKSLAEAEKETAVLSEFHHKAFSTAPIGLVIFDENCKLIDCNKAVLEMFGITKEEYLNNPDMITPEYQPDGSSSREKALENMKRVMAGETIKTEWLYCTTDGDYIPSELSLYRIKRKDTYFGFGYFYDLRSIKKFELALAEAEEHIKLMLDSCPLSCQLWDSDLKLIDCNEAAILPFGLQSKQEYMDLFPKLSPEYQNDGIPSIEKGNEYLKKAFMEGRCVFNWTHQTLDGTPIPAEVTLVRVKYRAGYVLAGYTRDLRIIKKLEERAGEIFYDPLTRIYNRRYFDENLSRMLKILSRTNSSLSIMMIDLDHFKKYNDTYGHAEGDKCLKTVADTLTKTITRDTDFVARYGGEEFVAVLPNADRDGACMIADKFLNNIRSCNITHEKNEAAPYVTISIGVTTGIVNHSQTEDDYIKRADEMLYLSKHNGRNQYNFTHL